MPKGGTRSLYSVLYIQIPAHPQWRIQFSTPWAPRDAPRLMAADGFAQLKHGIEMAAEI